MITLTRENGEATRWQTTGEEIPCGLAQLIFFGQKVAKISETISNINLKGKSMFFLIK